MNRTDRVYSHINQKKVVTSEELSQYARAEFGWDYKYLYLKYLRRLVDQGRLLRIRRGLYAARNPYDPDESLPDKYLVGSKIREDYYLGFHTALELLGAGHSVNNGCYVAVPRSHPFRPFELAPLHFRGIIARDLHTEIMTLEPRSGPVRLSSPSRTFVEALLRPDLAGGFEEVFLCLEGLGGVGINGILSVLDIYLNDNLCRKVGFFLEKLANMSPYYAGITSSDIEKIENRIGTGLLYMDREVPSSLVRRWGLYVPQTLLRYIEGGS